jgi:hypothetical protein
MGLELPRDLLHSFSLVVKSESEAKGRTLEPSEITTLFLQIYRILDKDPRVLAHQTTHGSAKSLSTVKAVVLIRGLPREIVGHGVTALEAISFGLSASADSRFQFDCTWGNIALANGQWRTISIVKCTSLSRSTWSAKTAETAEEAQVLASLSAALVSMIVFDRWVSADWCMCQQDWQKDLPLHRQSLRLLPIVHVAT